MFRSNRRSLGLAAGAMCAALSGCSEATGPAEMVSTATCTPDRARVLLDGWTFLMGSVELYP